jgi:hypothetical protein
VLIEKKKEEKEEKREKRSAQFLFFGVFSEGGRDAGAAFLLW